MMLPERNSNGFKNADLIKSKRRVNDKLKRVRNAIDLVLLLSSEEVKQ